jgi:hypothetical protein
MLSQFREAAVVKNKGARDWISTPNTRSVDRCVTTRPLNKVQHVCVAGMQATLMVQGVDRWKSAAPPWPGST